MQTEQFLCWSVWQTQSIVSTISASNEEWNTATWRRCCSENLVVFIIYHYHRFAPGCKSFFLLEPRGLPHKQEPTAYCSRAFHLSPFLYLSQHLILSFLWSTAFYAFFNINGRMLQANLSWTREKSNSSDAKKTLVLVHIFLFCT